MTKLIAKRLALAALLAASVSSVSALDPLYAGLRASKYGFGYPNKDTFGKAIKSMASRWGATPTVVWIASTYSGSETEGMLSYFDDNGITCLLQTEPFSASVTGQIDNLMNAYKKHKCVLGFGIDVEWYKGGEIGTPVTDADARAFRTKLQSHGTQYILMLKHFFPRYMPPTEREGIMFLDDSQQFPNFDRFINETDPNTQWNIGYRVWANTFKDNLSGMQYGYNDAAGGPSDRLWWSKIGDPPKEIGDSILAAGHNTRFLYWVDFTWQDAKVKEWPMCSQNCKAPPGHPANSTGMRRFAASPTGLEVDVRGDQVFVNSLAANYGREIGIQVFGMNGTKLVSRSFPGRSKVEFGLDPAMAKGRYFLKVVSGDQAWSGSFLK